MATYDDWKGRHWHVDMIVPTLKDLQPGDSLSFFGTGNKDGDLKRSNVGGTPSWAVNCEYLPGDRVGVQHKGETEQHVIVRSGGQLICWPPGKVPPLLRQARRDGDNGDVTGASWTAHDPGSNFRPCPEPDSSERAEISDRRSQVRAEL